MLVRTVASWRHLSCRRPVPLRFKYCRHDDFANRRHNWTPREPHIEEDPAEEERLDLPRFVKRGRRLAYVGFRKWRTEERERSYGFSGWHDYQSPFRRLRVWSLRSIFSGGSFRRLAFPDLAVIGATSSSIVYYNTCRACRTPEEIEMTCMHGFEIWTHPSMLVLPIEPFTLTSMSVGLLVAFRTQTCHQRFMEARTLWQQLANESRSLVSRILERVPSQSNGPCTNVVSVPRKRLEVIKWVRTLPHVLRYHLTSDGGTFDHSDVELPSDPVEIKRLEAEKMQRMREELSAIWDYIDPVDRNCVQRLFHHDVFNRPLYVLHQISHFNSLVYGDFVGAPVAADYNRSVIAMHHVVGNCERLIQTPIYSPYTRAASRILFLYCNMLPLGLFPLVGPTGTVPLTIVISFFLLSIEDIGTRIEQPFVNLPIIDYCAFVDKTCEDMIEMNMRRSGEWQIWDTDRPPARDYWPS